MIYKKSFIITLSMTLISSSSYGMDKVSVRRGKRAKQAIRAQHPGFATSSNPYTPLERDIKETRAKKTSGISPLLKRQTHKETNKEAFEALLKSFTKKLGIPESPTESDPSTDVPKEDTSARKAINNANDKKRLKWKNKQLSLLASVTPTETTPISGHPSTSTSLESVALDTSSTQRVHSCSKDTGLPKEEKNFSATVEKINRLDEDAKTYLTFLIINDMIAHLPPALKNKCVTLDPISLPTLKKIISDEKKIVGLKGPAARKKFVKEIKIIRNQIAVLEKINIFICPKT